MTIQELKVEGFEIRSMIDQLEYQKKELLKQYHEIVLRIEEAENKAKEEIMKKKIDK